MLVENERFQSIVKVRMLLSKHITYEMDTIGLFSISVTETRQKEREREITCCAFFLSICLCAVKLQSTVSNTRA